MFKENHAIFLADFGIDVEFSTRAGIRFTTRAIFDCAEMDGDLGKNAKIATTQPRISLPLENLSGIARGDTVRLNDANVFPAGTATFRVLEIINEGTGWATLPLAPATTEKPGA